MNIRQNFIAYQTLTRKEIVRFLRIWTQTLLPPAITTTLYFLIFGKLIGSQINHIEGFTYMQYIVPGLIMMPIITSAYMNTVSSFFMAKFQRSIEEMLVSPMPNSIILLGYVTGGIMRSLLTGIIVTVLALFFTHLSLHNLSVTLSIAFLTAVLFSLAGFVNAVYAEKFDDISIVPTFILTPLTYLGGVFYSLSMLSGIWHTISLFNPILYIVNAFRYGILGISDVNIDDAFILIVTAVVILYFFSLYLLKKGTGMRS